MTGKREATYLVTFGLALVLAMATVLFALVALNPKDENYGFLPWIYSAASLLGSVVCWRVSGRLVDKTVVG